MPACGVTPLAIPKAMARGRATRPTVMPAIKVGHEIFAAVYAQALN